MKDVDSESGGVLFYLFLAIALFAALGFAVSQTSRGGSDINEELFTVRSGEIIQYATSLRNAVKTLKIDGVLETDISFENQIVSGYNHTPAQPDMNKIFIPSGGGLSYFEPETVWLDSAQFAAPFYGEWLFTADNNVKLVGSETNNAADKELIVLLPYLKQGLCMAINDKLGVPNPGGDAPQAAGAIGLTQFQGTYAGGGTDLELPVAEQGKLKACFKSQVTPTTGTYHFYQVLIVR